MAYGDYLVGENVILTVATTGGVHGKDANSNLPEQPAEIATPAEARSILGMD